MLTLKFIVGGLIATIAIIVGATSLGITLITSLDTINKVGEAWALGMANGVKELVKNEFVKAEGRLLSAQPFMRANAPMIPADLADLGQNWTDTWTNFLTVQGVKMDYLFTSMTVIFAGPVWWMYTAQSRIDLAAQDMEWIESLNGGSPTVGGRRFFRDNLSDFPWDARTNFLPESLYWYTVLNLQEQVSFRPIKNTLRSKTNAQADPKEPACFWLPPSHVGGMEAVDIFFDIFGACDMKNSTGHLIGYVFVSLALDKQLRALITNSPRSPNGNNFIIDDKGFLIATTYSAPFYTSEPTTTLAQPADGCSNSYTVYPSAPPRMGCRDTPKSYDYPPLNAVPESIYQTEDETSFDTVTAGGDDYIAVGKRFTTEKGGLSFVIVSIVPVNDLLGSVNEGTTAAIGAAVGLTFFAVAIAVVVLFAILQPLDEMAAKMQRTAQLEGLDKEDVLVDDDDEVEGDDEDVEDESGNAIKNNNNNNRRKSLVNGRRKSVMTANDNGQTSSMQHHQNSSSSWISEIAQLEAAYVVTHNSLVSFTRYVPKNVVKELMNAGGAAKMSMQSTTITCSFADIQGFTSICEAVQPKQLSEVLHLYFKKMTRLVMAHGGIIDRFIGDCIMAVWGAPFKVARHELLGALCALASQREAARNPLKQKFLDCGFKLAVRIGVASGSVLAGNIGSKTRVAYTVLGEAVQAANALEPYNKQWGTLVMVNEEVARECNEELVLRLFTRAKFTGCTKPTMCYEVMGTSRDAVLRRTRSSKGNGGENGEGTDSNSTSEDMHHSNSAPRSPAGSSPLLGVANDDIFTTTTTVTDSSFGGGSSSGNTDEDDLLPANVNLESLLKWHKKRTSVDDSVVNFATLFSEAARSTIDKDFVGALKRIKSVEEDERIPLNWKTHSSIEVLKDLIGKAMMTGQVHPSICIMDDGEHQDFYVKVGGD